MPQTQNTNPEARKNSEGLNVREGGGWGVVGDAVGLGTVGSAYPGK